jgi:hypothetical protein
MPRRSLLVVNFGLPATSPMAHTPGAVVCRPVSPRGLLLPAHPGRTTVAVRILSTEIGCHPQAARLLDVCLTDWMYSSAIRWNTSACVG